MYSNVPQSPLRFGYPLQEDRPKSVNLRYPSELIKTFSGFKLLFKYKLSKMWGNYFTLDKLWIFCEDILMPG